MKILILYTEKQNTPNKEGISLEIVKNIAGILQKKHEVILLEYHPESLMISLENESFDLVFNMVYGFHKQGSKYLEKQSDIVKKLEMLNLPVIGSSSKVQCLAEDKLECSRKLKELGFDVPKLLFKNDSISNGKIVVKERFGACHRNISIHDSKNYDFKHVDWEKYIVEEYIDGDEYTVGVLELNEKLISFIPGRVFFQSVDKDQVLGLNKCEVELIPAPELSSSLGELSKKIHSRLELKGYSRIDFKVNHQGPKCIDVNCLPNLDPVNSFFPMLALFSGIEYQRLIELLASHSNYESYL